MALAFIALGSNLQQPVTQIQRAFVAIQAIPRTQVLAQSSVYRTSPQGCEQVDGVAVPDFMNAVVKVNTALTPEILLESLLSIEDHFGRKRPFRNAPRVLDLDLLLYDNLEMHTARLSLPHPRMHERAFVTWPLAEIAPELILANGVSVVELAKQHSAQGIQKL